MLLGSLFFPSSFVASGFDLLINYIGPSIFTIIIIIPYISIQIRRLNDIGKNPLWILINLIPIIGQAVLLFFFIEPSKEQKKIKDA